MYLFLGIPIYMIFRRSWASTMDTTKAICLTMKEDLKMHCPIILRWITSLLNLYNTFFLFPFFNLPMCTPWHDSVYAATPQLIRYHFSIIVIPITYYKATILCTWSILFPWIIIWFQKGKMVQSYKVYILKENYHALTIITFVTTRFNRIVFYQ